MAEGEDETTVAADEPSTSKKKKGGKNKKGGKKDAAGKRNKKKQPKGSIVWALPRKPPLGPSYSPCPHIYFKHSVVNRSKLDQKKYDSLLATPKGEPWIEPPEELQKFRRRPLTPRTECLAMPQKRKMEAQLEEFSGILTSRMTENLGALLETDCDLTASHIVIYPKGCSAETSCFLKKWAKWLFESYSKIYYIAGRLQKITKNTEERIFKRKISLNPNDPTEKLRADMAWRKIIEETKSSVKDMHAAKQDIVKSARTWEKCMHKKLTKADSKSKKKPTKPKPCCRSNVYF